MKMKLLRGYFRAKGLLEDFAKESRARREAFRADSYGTLQNYPYTAKMRCTDSAPKKQKEWRNERHFAGKVE